MGGGKNGRSVPTVGSAVPRYTWDKTRRIAAKLAGRMFLDLSLKGSGGDHVEFV